MDPVSCNACGFGDAKLLPCRQCLKHWSQSSAALHPWHSNQLQQSDCLTSSHVVDSPQAQQTVACPKTHAALSRCVKSDRILNDLTTSVQLSDQGLDLHESQPVQPCAQVYSHTQHNMH